MRAKAGRNVATVRPSTGTVLVCCGIVLQYPVCSVLNCTISLGREGPGSRFATTGMLGVLLCVTMVVTTRQLAVCCRDSNERQEQYKQQFPRMNTIATKSHIVNERLSKVTRMASRLRKETGVDSPSGWVTTITDKMYNIASSPDGTLMTSNRFMLQCKKEDLTKQVRRYMKLKKKTKKNLVSKDQTLSWARADYRRG